MRSRIVAKHKLNWEDITQRLCSVAEAAETLGLSESRVKDYCGDGALQAVKIGRAWMIDRESVRQLAEELAG